MTKYYSISQILTFPVEDGAKNAAKIKISSFENGYDKKNPFNILIHNDYPFLYCAHKML